MNGREPMISEMLAKLKEAFEMLTKKPEEIIAETKKLDGLMTEELDKNKKAFALTEKQQPTPVGPSTAVVSENASNQQQTSSKNPGSGSGGGMGK